jgi:hypothetical protein
MIDDKTKFPSNLVRVDVYNLSFLRFLPSSIVKRIEEIRVLNSIDYHTQILLAFSMLKTLHISSSVSSRCLVLSLPSSMKSIYVKNVFILRILGHHNLEIIDAPNSIVELDESVGESLEKIVCWNTNVLPKKHLELYSYDNERLFDSIVLEKEYMRSERKTRVLMRSLYKENYTIRSVRSKFKSIDLTKLPDTLEVYINMNNHAPNAILPRNLKYLEWNIKRNIQLNHEQITSLSGTIRIGLEFKDSTNEESIESLNIKCLERIPDNAIGVIMTDEGEEIENIKLPDSLKRLYCVHRLEKFPSALEELNIRCYSYDHIPEFPQKLKILHITINKEFPLNFPESLEEISIKLDGCKMRCINGFPSRLKKLHISYNNYNDKDTLSIGSLPDSIQELTLTGSIQLPIVLPFNLRILSVNKIIWNKFPSSLKELYVNGISRIYSLPAGIKKIEAPHSVFTYNSNIDKLSKLESLSIYCIECSKLPETLRSLSITFHNGILELPEKLESLSVISGNYEIKRFPKNLRKLYITGNGEKKIGELPPYLEMLTVKKYNKEIRLNERLRYLSTDETIELLDRYPKNIEVIYVDKMNI